MKQSICDQAESSMMHQVVDAVYRKFQVAISSDQLKYVMNCNSTRNKERARGSCGAGGAGDAVDFLLQKMNSDAVLLLNNCATGDWFDATARLSKDKNTEIVLNKLSEWKPKKFQSIDDNRVIDIEGESYLVWSAAWN
jgi:hypothetical protein